MIWIKTIIVQNSPYLYLCCTSCPGNFIHTCIWSLLDCYLNVTFSTPLLFMSCISLWEGTGLPQNLLCGFGSPAMWVMLPVFHSSSPIVSIAETVYKMCARICVFICKCVRHFEYPMVLQHNKPQPLAKSLYKQELSQDTA